MEEDKLILSGWVLQNIKVDFEYELLGAECLEGYPVGGKVQKRSLRRDRRISPNRVLEKRRRLNS